MSACRRFVPSPRGRLNRAPRESGVRVAPAALGIGAALLVLVRVVVPRAAERDQVRRRVVVPVAVGVVNLETLVGAAAGTGVAVTGEDPGPQPSPFVVAAGPA